MSDSKGKQDSTKTKEELLHEVSDLRKRVDELEKSQTESGKDKDTSPEVKGKYYALFNKIIDPILIYDKETHQFLECNDAATRIYGYSKDELMAMTPFDLHAKEDFEKVKDSLESGTGDLLFTYTHVTKYGQHLSVEVVSDEINYDGHPAWLSVVRDVTDRKLVEDNLVHDRNALGQRVKERTYQLEEVNKQMKQELIERKKMEEELKNSFKTLRKTMEGVVHAMAIVVEARDPYTAGHQRRVAALACAIGKEMGLPIDKIEGIRVACLLHDVGKITIPIEILSKPGRLTETEFSFIKKHPQVGFDILKGIEFPWEVAEIVHQHHERIDGSGYPLGLIRERILLEARILGVADVVEAMSSHRPYRPARGIDKALAEILQNRGVIYEPDVVNSCIKLFAEKKFDFS
jgi:PAS domain S-box-containing protein/putative nucleotidyltransferase with HDIG domain